ncbi:hypothetical protein DNHGIG_17220 [Collibacillus ludicampi]|uniref:Reverse transcriptase domain-containing protein n=1 Tax=Collibacillus ludicampi TaxID=2771369 RepID=A0AAV4LER2_9BACL|nr:hypothetical protein DNHGIG_17220 [Collibacillus ludicampi]
MLEFDIKGLFDNIDHELLMKAVRKHTDNPWVILYIERWLKAPFEMPDGTVVERTKGTPQGGVISPVLANLFLHYAFDKWMRRLRMCLLKQWKEPKTRRRNLIALGIPEEQAVLISGSRKGYWRLSRTPQLNKALGLTYWRKQGLTSLVDRLDILRSTT